MQRGTPDLWEEHVNAIRKVTGDVHLVFSKSYRQLFCKGYNKYRNNTDKWSFLTGEEITGHGFRGFSEMFRRQTGKILVPVAVMKEDRFILCLSVRKSLCEMLCVIDPDFSDCSAMIVHEYDNGYDFSRGFLRPPGIEQDLEAILVSMRNKVRDITGYSGFEYPESYRERIIARKFCKRHFRFYTGEAFVDQAMDLIRRKRPELRIPLIPLAATKETTSYLCLGCCDGKMYEVREPFSFAKVCLVSNCFQDWIDGIMIGSDKYL